MTELRIVQPELRSMTDTPTTASNRGLQRLRSLAAIAPAFTGVEQATPTAGHILSQVPDSGAKAVLIGALAAYGSAIKLVTR